MASPFAVFRKHQKIMIASLGLMAMIAFVFLGTIQQTMSSRAVSNPAALSTDQYGEITERQLVGMKQQRQIVLNFLQAAIQLSGGDYVTIQRRLQDLSILIGPNTERSVVDTWLLAQRAEQLGMVVSDRAVNSYLMQLTENAGQNPDLRLVLERQGVSQGALFRALRTELAAQRLRVMFLSSLSGVPPAQRWDYYRRLNRRAKIEVVPVAVEQFVETVPDPSEESLREFFEEHKDRYPDRASPEPGFRQRRQISLAYLKGQWEKFLDPDSVTEEEIKQYYEQNKDPIYIQTSLPPIDETKPPAKADKKAAGKEPSADTAAKQPGTAEPASAAKPQKASTGKDASTAPAEKDAEPTPPAEGPKPPVEKPAPKTLKPAKQKAKPKPAENANQTDKAKEAGKTRETGKTDQPETAKDAKKDSAKPGGAGKAAAIGRESPFRLVSLSPEEPKTPPQPKTPAEATGPGQEKTAQPEAAAAKAGQPAVAPPVVAKPDQADAGKEQPNEGEVGKKKDAGSKKPKYKPLEEVREEIRKHLARQKANAKIADVLDRLRIQMDRYYRKRVRYLADKQQDGNVQAPAEPNLQALAEQHGLSAHFTGLVSAPEAVELDIGKSMAEGKPLIEELFGKSLPDYRPVTSEDIDRNQYLCWKTVTVEERVPKFRTDDAAASGDVADEDIVKDINGASVTVGDKLLKTWEVICNGQIGPVHNEVLLAWKRVQAREPALQEAQRLAEEARSKSQSLKHIFGSRAAESDSFSWLTRDRFAPRGRQPQLRIGRIRAIATDTGDEREDDAVVMPGHELMQTVFGLKTAEVGVAMNYPKTIAYVVRQVSTSPSDTMLRETFLVDDFNTYINVWYQDQSRTFEAWNESIRTAAGLVWKRPPDRTER